MSRSDRNPAKVRIDSNGAEPAKPCADCIRANALLGLANAREEELRLKHDRVVKTAVALIGGSCPEHDEIALNLGLQEFIEAYPKGCMWCLQRSLVIANASISMLQQAVLDAREHRGADSGSKCQALIHMTEKRDLLRQEMLMWKSTAASWENLLNLERHQRRGTDDFNPDWVVLPWDHVEEAMEHLGIKEDQLNLHPDQIRGLVMGTHAITIDLAQRLEDLTKRPARLWLQLEANYRLGLAQGKTQT